MHLKTLFCVGLLGLALSFSSSLSGEPNDDIFPASDAAKSSITFDEKGFIINGERTFIASGSLHYPRAPRAQWRDILLRFKRAGFTTVQSYAFWNYHEEKEGQWDFSGEKDFDAFLKTAQQVGLFVTVRVGAYVCAEWDSGGYPVWLRFKGVQKLRDMDPAFIAASDEWYRHIFKIVSANQINHGGSVILVQLENEHPLGWGTDMPNDYFKHLQTLALSLGLEVPYFFSGLHHGSDPSPKQPIESSTRKSPWYTTEFWSVWYDHYGEDDQDVRTYDRANWRILANGGNGYNYYMLFGGTDFGYTNDHEMASSYDYGAAVGQALDLRPLYYRFKRAAWFGQSFASIMEDSDNDTSEYADAADKGTFKISARKAPAGTIVFLDNKTDHDAPTRLTLPDGSSFPDQPVTIPAQRFEPFIFNYQLAPGIQIGASTPIYGISKNPNEVTLLVYGVPGEPAQVNFKIDNATRIDSGPLTQKDGGVIFAAQVPASGVQAADFDAGGKHIRILAVSATLADRTWFVNADGTNYLIGGPDYVGDVQADPGGLRINAEKFFKPSVPPVEKYFVSGPRGVGTLNAEADPADTTDSAPALGGWTAIDADAEAAAGFNDASWLATRTPQEMGADGDASAYAWYRTKATIPSAGDYALRFSDVGDFIKVFVDGKPVAESPVTIRSDQKVPYDATFKLTAGAHILAFLTAHYGRDKLFGYLGNPDDYARKGVAGPVSLFKSSSQYTPIAITTWKWRPSPGGEETATTVTSDNSSISDWKDAQAGQNVFDGKPGYAWFEVDLPAGPAGRHLLHFDKFFENGYVYLNGKRMAEKHGRDKLVNLPLDDGWKADSTNRLFILVRNDATDSGIVRGAIVQLFPPDSDAIPLAGFKMRGGLGNYLKFQGTAFDVTQAPDDKTPRLFGNQFTIDPTVEPGFVYRLTFKGLSRGFMFLNGHNLGRYPEKVPIDGLYLPVCWMVNGANKIQIYDEEGKSPNNVRIYIEKQASGHLETLTYAP